MGILSIDPTNVNLDDTNFDEDDPETIINVRLLAWDIKFEKLRALKKELNEELMVIVWHPRIWGNFRIPENEKKEKEPILLSNTFN